MFVFFRLREGIRVQSSLTLPSRLCQCTPGRTPALPLRGLFLCSLPPASLGFHPCLEYSRIFLLFFQQFEAAVAQQRRREGPMWGREPPRAGLCSGLCPFSFRRQQFFPLSLPSFFLSSLPPHFLPSFKLC